MKIITFLLKLIFLVYTLKWLVRSWKETSNYVDRGGNDAANDMPGGGSLFMAIICALPTLTIAFYIMQAIGKIQ